MRPAKQFRSVAADWRGDLYDHDLPPWLATCGIRDHLFKVFSAVCQYCGCRVYRSTGFYDWQRATVDRVVPGAKGGLYVETNVTLSCLRCNMKKSSFDFHGPVRRLSDVGGHS